MHIRKMTAVVAVIAGLGLATTGEARASTECGHHLITSTQYDAVKRGWLRWRTQQLFDNCGVRIVMWADEHGRRHIVKDYPTDTVDTTVEVTFVGPASTHRFAGPMRVERKALS